MSRHPPAGGLRELMERLWAERHLLEFLLFKLVVARLVLAADARRFVTPALGEVEIAIERLREVELLRATALSRVAEDWGIPPEELTLGYLAEHAPEPEATMFAEHHEAFLELASEIEEQAAENRRIATAALRHVRDNLDMLVGGQIGTTYAPSGRREVVQTSPRRVDRDL
jgi:hypothetical protein